MDTKTYILLSRFNCFYPEKEIPDLLDRCRLAWTAVHDKSINWCDSNVIEVFRKYFADYRAMYRKILPPIIKVFCIRDKMHYYHEVS